MAAVASSPSSSSSSSPAAAAMAAGTTKPIPIAPKGTSLSQQQQTPTIGYYIKNYFKVPRQMKNDIIYCQRALKAHLNIHQMVIEVFKQQGNANPIHKKRVLDEIESEIYEINAEQQFLLLRLRRIIDEFNKMLKRNGIAANINLLYNVVSQEIVPAVIDLSIAIPPITVRQRSTEQQLIQKYFEYKSDEGHDSTQPKVTNNNNDDGNMDCFEVLDSDEEEERMKNSSNPKDRSEVKTSTTPKDQQKDPNTAIQTVLNGFSAHYNYKHNKKHYGISSTLSKDSKVALPMKKKMKLIAQQQIRLQQESLQRQLSLLKPLVQRSNGANEDSGVLADSEPFTDPSQFVEVTQDDSNQEDSPSIPYNEQHAGGKSKKSKVDSSLSQAASNALPVSKNVTISRLNLRQALKKAQTENKAKAAAAAYVASVASNKNPVKRPVEPQGTSSNQAATLPVPKKPESRIGRPPRNAAAASNMPAPPIVSTNNKNIELNSSSEDSNPDQQFSSFPNEGEQFPTTIDEYDQASFLRGFNLFTKDALSQMQQRRSKRKRRCVHNNERSDFHYGRIEYGGHPSTDDNKKKRKAFLLSPHVKRLQAKRARVNQNADKLDEPSSSSRSSSSSPDDKRCCKECLKTGGFLESCEDCKAYYHQSCHREEDFNMDAKNHKEIELLLTQIKLCPSCKISQMKLMLKENQQFRTLQELESKMAKLKSRRSNLQNESKMYKIQMSNLFNIVNSIKITTTTTKTTKEAEGSSLGNYSIGDIEE